MTRPGGGPLFPREDYGAGPGSGLLPTGGTAGQVLTKNTGTDYDASWATPSSGGGSSGGGALVPLFDITLLAAAPSISVPGIPAIYRDLVFSLDGRCSKAAFTAEVRAQFNGDTAANYDYQIALMNGANDADVEGRGITYMHLGYLNAASAAANSGGGLEGRIFNYASTAFNKNVTTQNYFPAVVSGAGFVYNDVGGGDWRSNSAISSILFFVDSGNFNIGVRLTVWGVAATPGGSGGTGATPDTPPPTANAADDEWEGASLDTGGTRRSGATAWTWDQQGTATAQLTRGRLILTAPGDGTGTGKMRSVLQTLPAGNGTYETEFRVFGLTGTFSAAGVVLRESGTDKRLWFVKGIDTGAKIQVRRLTSFTAWTANPYNSGSDEALAWETFYAKVERSGTSLILSLGDGAYYSTRYSFTETTEFTTAANQIGLAAWAISAETVVLTSGFWRKTA